MNKRAADAQIGVQNIIIKKVMQFCRRRRNICQGSVGGVHAGSEPERDLITGLFMATAYTHTISHTRLRAASSFSVLIVALLIMQMTAARLLYMYELSVLPPLCFFVHAWCAHAARVLHFRPRTRTHSSEREKKTRKTDAYAKGQPKIHRAAQNASRESSAQMNEAEQTYPLRVK